MKKLVLLTFIFLFSAGMAYSQSYYEQTRKAANLGSTKAQNNLGGMYYNGEVVVKDYEQAAYWYEKAADQGDEDAKQVLNKLGVKW